MYIHTNVCFFCLYTQFPLYRYVEMKFVYKFNGQIDLGQMFIRIAKDA